MDDLEFAIASEFCAGLVGRIRQLMTNPADLDPNDVPARELEYLIKVFVKLNAADLAAGSFPTQAEVTVWRQSFFDHFDASDCWIPEVTAEEIRQRRDEYAAVFTDFLATVEGY